MSAVPYELRVVPPPSPRSRFAAVLVARATASRALDAALSVPRRAAGFIGRVIAAVGSSQLVSVIRSFLSRAVMAVSTAGSRWGGPLSAGVLALGSSTVRGLIGRGLSLLGRGLGWLGQTIGGALDRGLRLFGKPGARVADGLQSALRRVTGWAGRAVTTAVGVVARVAVRARGVVSVLTGVVRALSVRTLVTRFVSSRPVALVVQGLLVPLTDGRVLRWLADLTRTAVTRVRALLRQRQRQQLATVTATRPEVVPSFQGPTEGPVPSNRAERRAHQRHQH